MNKENLYLTEASKETKEYIETQVNSAIGLLVKDKKQLIKARKCYYGQRDEGEFAYIEDMYGIESATSIPVIPLVSRHINSLLGTLESRRFAPKIYCRDTHTLKKIAEQKEEYVKEKEYGILKKNLMNNINQAFYDELGVSEDIEAMRSNLDSDFVSSFELVAQDFLEMVQNNAEIDLSTKRIELFREYLIYGSCFYRVRAYNEEEIPEVEVLCGEDVFIEENPNSAFYNKSTRAVVRKFMTQQDFFEKYGQYLSKADIKDIKQPSYNPYETDSFYFSKNPGSLGTRADVGITINGLENREDPGRLLTVYEVEWLDSNPVEIDDDTFYRTDRYFAVKVGDKIISFGKDEYAPRSVHRPLQTTLSINGISNRTKKGEPYSLVIACLPLQNKYDLVHYLLEHTMVNSGVKGQIIDFSLIPEHLGDTPEERLLSFLALRKQGSMLIDTSSEGDLTAMNTIFNGFDDSLQASSIQGLQLISTIIEDTCSGITGVFRELLQAAEERDAVANVEVGIRQSAVITKPLFSANDKIMSCMTLDIINGYRVAYKNGISGSITMDDGSLKVFTADPVNYSFTDYGMGIWDSDEQIQALEKLKGLAAEFIKTGQADMSLIVEIMNANSVSKLQKIVDKHLSVKKQAQEQVSQLTQQLEQMQQQMQQMEQEANKIQQQYDVLNKRNIDLEEFKVKKDLEIKEKQVNDQEKFNADKVEIEKSKLELEKVQLYDNNPYNDKVKYS